jgi:hypothetical protein
MLPSEWCLVKSYSSFGVIIWAVEVTCSSKCLESTAKASTGNYTQSSDDSSSRFSKGVIESAIILSLGN